MLPSHRQNRVGTRISVFAAQYPAHRFLYLRFDGSLATASARLEARMESLFLSCRALASPTICRFIPARLCRRFSLSLALPFAVPNLPPPRTRVMSQAWHLASSRENIATELRCPKYLGTERPRVASETRRVGEHFPAWPWCPAEKPGNVVPHPPLLVPGFPGRQ